MKKKVLFILVVFFSGLITAQTQNDSLLRKIQGFSHPESVVYDEQRDVLYVSNIGEEEAGDGFISRVSLDGEVVEMRWITGLEDPKGLQIQEDKLYVTDVTKLVEINIEEGRKEQEIDILNSQYLNDITKDDAGNLYISDSGKSGIYRRSGSGEIAEWLVTEHLEFPNGLLMVDNKLYVAAWGGDGGGNVLRVDPETKQIEQITSEGIGNLDGIQKPENEEFFIISDWADGTIYRVDPSGTVEEILTAERSAGDILHLEEKNQLVLPMNLQNEVWWYQLE